MGVPARSRQTGPAAFTWANRPSISSVPARTRIWISDVGPGGGSEWYSDGTNWRPVGNILYLGGAITPVTFTAQSPSYKVNAGHTYNIPGGLIIPGCYLRTSAKWETAANTDNKYFRTILNLAASANNYVSNYNVNGATSIVLAAQSRTDFVTTSSQVGTASALPEIGAAASANWTTAINTNNDFTVGICCSITSTTDSVTMRSCSAELYFR